MDITPTIFAGCLAFVVSVMTRRTFIRLLGWWVIPLALVGIAAGTDRSSMPRGEGVVFWLVFAYSFMIALVTSGIGTLAGCFLNKVMEPRT